eukprot:jgi/Undpi1/11689/HiC_scaffold_36.g13984.m1
MFLTPPQQQKQLGRHLQAMPNYSTVWMMVPVVTVVVPQRTVIAVMLMRQGTREQKCASVRREEAASRLLTAASTETILCESFEHEPRTQEVPEDSGLDIPEDEDHRSLPDVSDDEDIQDAAKEGGQAEMARGHQVEQDAGEGAQAAMDRNMLDDEP